ncbi:uncharacterized protein PHACADRAFT_203537 [Phanerochaete carnosa HHB-10118-sp]|uniref:Uncharacterized protein n=1 Tax=Phanerochaete carnosa (strain HHB-10118-sp) TaxID=650164 RepID=K5W8S1_PHACS|nr:uncharacterized protein PHACADRAFT_203537 [Phanerochaete carnosa HHB-10118-sp]EKM60303.1 hypothetical protein PHACADRAFT_203537 [Phanerochaete carnosa HHB-10118-sp]
MITSDPSPSSTLAELKALSKIIQDSIISIEASLSSANKEFPSPYTPITRESEAARMVPGVDKACTLIITAAYQLIQSVQSPMLSIMAIATQHALPAALGVASAANVAEALREAGPNGAHVNEIARASNIDPSKLARVLRLLATNHIFVEVAPDVFVNNRISSCMDTGKSVKAILESPETKHIATNCVAASVEHWQATHNSAATSAAHLSEFLLDPKTAMSQELNNTAFNIAFNTDIPVWEWLEKKENERRFDWDGLKQGAVIVDVGGGVGAQSLALAQNCPHLRFVVQDREQVTKDAAGFWNDKLPDALPSGRVELQAHDFFTPQPVKNASVFLLRSIIHDWPDKYCLQILRHLRAAATPDTRLVIVDSLVSYACEDSDLKHIPGIERPVPPKPLLPNMGYAALTSYQLDIQMLSVLNGKERTIAQMKELMDQTGWKLVQVHQALAFSTSKVIGAPA